MYYKLVLLEGAVAGGRREWNLSFPTIVGRGEEVGIVLNDPSISRRHCKFSVNAHGAVAVQDLDSKNGIYVRDERVKSATILLGEAFQIGGLRVKVEEISAPLDAHTAQHTTSDDRMYETQHLRTFEID